MRQLALIVLTFFVTMVGLDIYFKKNRTLELISRYGSGQYVKKVNLYRFLDEQYKSNKALQEIPRDPPFAFEDSAEGISYTYYGYNFKVPWRRLNRLQIDRDVAGIRFDNGVSLIVVNPDIERQHLSRIVKSMEYARFGEQQFEQLLDNKMRMSTFDFYNGVLSAKIHIKHLMSTHDDLVWLAVLTGFKVSMLGESPKPVYNFKNFSQRAFQIGDPARDKEVNIYAFPELGRPVKFTLRIQNPSQNLQRGINQLVASIK